MSNVAAVRSSNAVETPAERVAGELTTIRNELPLTLDPGAMDSMMRLAEIMATGKATVPPEYRGNPGDCLAVVMQAVQWKMNPYAVAQKTYFVSGKIGYEAQLINAVITALAPTEDRIHYEWYGPWENVIGKYIEKTNAKGDTYRKNASTLADEKGVGVKVWATIKGEKEPRVLDLKMSQAATRNSTLWADDPRQQLAYLAVKRWARLYTPDVIMGVYSPDELEEPSAPIERDMGAAEVVKDKLSPGNGKSKPDQAPTLAEVLKAIAAATTPDEMESASVLAGKIKDRAEIGKAREAWKARLAELKAAAAAKKPATDVDTDTGEIKDQQKADAKTEAPKVEYEALLKQLQNAADVDVLDNAATLIGAIDDFDRRNTLDRAYQARRKELVDPK